MFECADYSVPANRMYSAADHPVLRVRREEGRCKENAGRALLLRED
jgi:hypothetical protein